MEQDPLFTEREVLEAQTPRHLAQFVLRHGERIAESERMIALANDVLGGMGTSIDVELGLLHETETNTAGA